MTLSIDAVQVYLSYFVGFMMLTGVFVNAIGPAAVREAYARWGFSPQFRYVTAILEAVATALILIGATCSAGLALAAAIMLAAMAILWRARQYLQSLPAALVLTAAVAAML